MSSAKSANCWALFVVKFTHPSAVGSMDGTSIRRDCVPRGGRPQVAAKSANTEGKALIPTPMQSSMATSTWVPTPALWARHQPANAPTAA